MNAVGGNWTNILEGVTSLAQPNFVTNPGIIQHPGIAIPKTTYAQMKSELLRQGQIFWDSEYSVNQIDCGSVNNRIEWKRPFEIIYNPQMFCSGISRFDINQGKLGDCWLLAAMASLVMRKNLLTKVVPLDQSFIPGDYCGMFRFHIWYYGQWLETVIDDLLPTVNGQLIYMNSNESNEFWSALLEKAYSKIYGSYKQLKGGCTSEAMVDFTGGITERITLRKDQALISNINSMNDLFYGVVEAFTSEALMSCSKEGGLEQMDNSGLVSRHAYSITALCVVNIINNAQVHLIRLRNPWGNHTEWKGPWCDGSREWSLVSHEELKRLNFTIRPDGEFWMSFYDFIFNFDKLEICHLTPQSFENLQQMRQKEIRINNSWDLKVLYGEWRKGISAGGCPDNSTHSMNPHFEFVINRADNGAYDGMGTVIISLMQRNLRLFKKTLLAIGYSIYKKPPQNNVFDLRQYFNSTSKITNSGDYINLREISGRYKLYPSTYIVIPSTFMPNQESQFLLRIYTAGKK